MQTLALQAGTKTTIHMIALHAWKWVRVGVYSPHTPMTGIQMLYLYAYKGIHDGMVAGI